MITSKMLTRIKTNIAGYSFVLPAIILISIFLIYPIGFVIYISFHKWGILGAPKFVGWSNYIRIFHDPEFLKAALNTVYWTGLAVPCQIGMGLLLAVMLNHKNIFARDLFRTIYFIPLAISFVASGILFNWLLTVTPMTGFFPTLFEKIGVAFPAWQTTAGGWAMVMLVLMNTWKSAGYCMVIYLAGLQGINPEYYEAAQIDGAKSEWQMFRHVSWPLLAPTTFLLVISATIFTIRAFEPIYVMTYGGPAGATTTIIYYVFRKFPNLMGVSSSASTVLLVAVLLLTLAQYLVNRRKEVYY